MNEPRDRANLDSDSVEPEVEMPSSQKVRVEEFNISGDTLLDKIKELVHQGNIRRIVIKNETGSTLLEIPMTVGLVGGAISVTLFPFFAAIGAIGALVARLKIVIERIE